MERRFDAVVLDLFGTLVKWSPEDLPEMELRGRKVHTTIPWLAPILERGLGSAFDLNTFIEAYGAAIDEIEAERLEHGIEITCLERFQRTLARLGAGDDAELAAALRKRHMSAVRQVTGAPPEWAAVVPRLAKRYRLGILSNFDDAESGLEIIEDTGVAEHFEFVVISAEVRLRKPNPKIFHQLLERMQLRPEDVLFVGDTPHEDVAGAHAAGIPVVWVSANKGAFPPHIGPPQYTIKNLAELPALLGV